MSSNTAMFWRQYNQCNMIYTHNIFQFLHKMITRCTPSHNWSLLCRGVYLIIIVCINLKNGMWISQLALVINYSEHRRMTPQFILMSNILYFSKFLFLCYSKTRSRRTCKWPLFHCWGYYNISTIWVSPTLEEIK